MFFSADILSRKSGKLGIVWLFATYHGDGTGKGPKIQKKEILAVSLPDACKNVAHPKQPFALRLSSNLLIGISRIYNKQQLFFWDELRTVWGQVQKRSERLEAQAQLLLNTKTARHEAITLAEPGGPSQMLWGLEAIDLEQMLANEYGVFTIDTSFGMIEDDVEIARGSDRRNSRMDAITLLPEGLANNADISLGVNDGDFTGLNDMEHLNAMDNGMDLGDMGMMDFGEISYEKAEEKGAGKMDADEGMDAGLFQGSPQIIEMGGDDMQLALVPTGEDEDVQAGGAKRDNNESQLPEMEPSTPFHPRRARRTREEIRRAKAKGLIIDEVIQIDSDVMRANLTDCSDMVLSKKDRLRKAHRTPTTKELFNRPPNTKAFQAPELLTVWQRGVDLAKAAPRRYADLFQGPDSPTLGAQEEETRDPRAKQDAMHEGYEPINIEMGDDAGMEIHLDMGDIEMPRRAEEEEETYAPSRRNSATRISLPWTVTPSSATSNQVPRARRESEDSVGTPLKRRRLSRRGSAEAATADGTGMELEAVTDQFEIDFGAYDEDQMASTMREEARDFYNYVCGQANVEGNVQFADLLPPDADRLVAAKAIYHVVVLSTMGAIVPTQQEPYSDISLAIHVGA